jgi:hypothetical protein
MPKKTKATQPAPEDDEEINILSFEGFDLERFALKPMPIADMKDKTQLLCFPKYAYKGDPEGDHETIMTDGEAPIAVTDEIVVNKGGIPRFNTKYHASPDSMGRAYFYIAEDPECPGSVELFNWVQKIDDHYDQKINKEDNADEIVCYTVKSKKTGNYIKKAFKGLTYKRMITETKKPTSIIEEEEDDDDSKKKNEYKPYKRIKVKFSTIWDKDLGPNDLKEIDTILFVPGNDEPMAATKVSDFDKYFTWKSTCKFGLMLNKFWIARDDERNCSFGLKCVQLAVTKLRPEGQKKTATTQLSRSLFTGKKFSRSDKEAEEEEEVDNNVEEEEEDEDEVSEDEVEEEDEEDEEDEVDEDEDEVDEDEVEESEEEFDEDEEEDLEEDEEEDADEDEDEEESEEEEPAPAPKRRAGAKKAPAKKGAKKTPAKKAPVKVKGKKAASKVKGKNNRK